MAQKFCSSCGEGVTPKAKFCQSCGHCLAAGRGASKAKPTTKKTPKISPEPEPVDTTAGYLDDFDSRESAQLSHEYFERHIEILSSYRKRLKMMAKGLDNREKRLAELAEGGFTEARTKEIQKTLENIEDIGDEWENLQLSYNQDSEVLDEEFQDRFAEMEVDVELPEDLQTKMSRELDVMTRSFDRIGERIAIVGTLGNRLISRASGRWFGDEGASSSGKVFVAAATIAGSATFLGLYFGYEMEVSHALFASIPGVLTTLLFAMRSS